MAHGIMQITRNVKKVKMTRTQNGKKLVTKDKEVRQDVVLYSCLPRIQTQTMKYNDITAVHLRVIRTKNKHGTLSYDWYVPVNITSPDDTSCIAQAE